jgi:hypothetical protein
MTEDTPKIRGVKADMIIIDDEVPAAFTNMPLLTDEQRERIKHMFEPYPQVHQPRPRVQRRRGGVEFLKTFRQLAVYLEPRDWWIGYYRGTSHHYVCVLPCLVIRWNRR